MAKMLIRILKYSQILLQENRQQVQQNFHHISKIISLGNMGNPLWINKIHRINHFQKTTNSAKTAPNKIKVMKISFLATNRPKDKLIPKYHLHSHLINLSNIPILVNWVVISRLLSWFALYRANTKTSSWENESVIKN